MSKPIILSLALAFPLASSAPAFVTLEWVTVGDAGNANASTGYGGVAYQYDIMKYEVTNAQYCEFLNNKAASDPNGLYNASMAVNASGGITRSGISGSYTYSVRTNFADKPVNYVSFMATQRFANWIHNGQGTGDTETGAYAVGNFTTHSVQATVWIPTENEWYKAAYYQPVGAGGPASSYWLYPTASNTAPTLAAATVTGVISNPGDNVANHSRGADWNVSDGNVTTVGSAGPLSVGYYGTFDQGGNVWEWTEAIVGAERGLRGGSWDTTVGFQISTYRDQVNPGTETSTLGFRLASVAAVPEPSLATLLLAAAGAMLLRRHRGAGFGVSPQLRGPQ